jgi:hypothetical protein
MNGMNIMGKKKKNIPNWNKTYDTINEIATIRSVSGQPDHFIILDELL